MMKRNLIYVIAMDIYINIILIFYVQSPLQHVIFLKSDVNRSLNNNCIHNGSRITCVIEE